MKPDARPHLSWIRCLAAALLGFAGTAQAVQPTISNVNDITGGSEDGSPIPTDIPFATLAAAANEADPDNTPVSFRIESFLPGSTLTLNGVNIIPGTTVFGSGTLRWTPPANTNGLLNAFAVKASSGGQVSESTVIVRVQIAEVDDPPTLGSVGAIAGGMEDTATSITFQEIQAAADEADIDSATINFRVESVISGELTSGGIPVQAGVTILSAGNPLSWTPAANANGLLAAFTLRAASGSEVSLNAVTVNVVTTPVNDAPTVAGSLPAAINDDSADSQASTAFLAGLTIADAENDNVDLVVRIAKTAEDLGDVVFPGVTRTESGSNYVYSFSSLTIAEANSRLDGARFNPIRDLLPAGTTQTFAVTVTVSDASTSSLTNSLNGNAGILSVDDPPQVALSFSSTSMPDNGPSQPFLVSINDPDSGANTSQTYTLTLTEIAPVRGVLTIPVALTGTKAQVEAAMTSVRYQPNAVTANVSASFTCTITAPTLPVPPASTASLLIVLDNDQPGIAGINVSAIRTDEGVAVHPFPTVIVTDPDAGQTLTVTITPDNTAKGSFFLDNAALTANTSVPIVVLTGTAAEVTPIRELDRIEMGSGQTAGSRGPITEKIQAAFFDIVHGRNPKYAEWLTHV